MADIPTRNSSGGLDCPRCGTTFVKGKAPFYLRGEYVGTFEALVCDICHYSLFTPSGYDHAMIEARKYGLVGPPEDIVGETLEASEQEFVFQETVVSSNIENTTQIITKPESKKVEDSSLSNIGEIPIPRPTYRERHQTKTTQILIKH
jgi:hypothetical protein